MWEQLLVPTLEVGPVSPRNRAQNRKLIEGFLLSLSQCFFCGEDLSFLASSYFYTHFVFTFGAPGFLFLEFQGVPAPFIQPVWIQMVCFFTTDPPFHSFSSATPGLVSSPRQWSLWI